MNAEDIIADVKKRIRSNGYSLAEVADKIGMSRANLSNNLNGKTSISAVSLLKLFEFSGHRVVVATTEPDKVENEKHLLELTELLRAKRTSLEAEIEHYKEEIEYLHKRIDFFREELNKCQKKRG